MHIHLLTYLLFTAGGAAPGAGGRRGLQGGQSAASFCRPSFQICFGGRGAVHEYDMLADQFESGFILDVKSFLLYYYQRKYMYL